MTTSVNQAIDMGTKVLPPVAGSTVNLGTLGTTQVTTTTTTTNQGAGFGVEGPGLGVGSGAVGYGTTSIDVRQGGSVATTQQIGVEGAGLGGTTAVGYGTTSADIAKASAIAPEAQIGMGVEGSAFPSQVNYGLGGQTTTTTTTTTTNAFGGNQIASTISPSFLPNAFTSVQPEEIANQPINA